jgi:hypothetical protein
MPELEKKMNRFIIMLAGLISASAFAADDGDPFTSIPAEKYSYSKKYDIARVLKIEEPANVCVPVVVHMIYEDSQGKKHNLEYLAMGSGCPG